MADADTDADRSTSSRAGCARSALLALGALLIVVYILTQAAGSGGDSDDEAARRSTITTRPRVTTTLVERPDAVEPECPEEDGSSPKQLLFTEAPPMCIDVDATYVATVATSRGTFEITLDPSRAPLGVNNFVFLARYHFYDGVSFHRVLDDLLAQAGDPFDPGVGPTGAGYTIAEEPPTAEPYYPKGTVALARETEPGTTASEFFVVTGEGGELLPPDYTVIGSVTSGIEVIDAIDATALPNDDIGFPSEMTVIESITIEEE
ncbi:MAG TPA: peptidylprolyl isomerase [Acidimicrobiales bacterium]